MFETILKVAMVIISVALIILCLLQSGKSDDIVNALTGQSSNLFAEQKERGVDLVWFWVLPSSWSQFYYVWINE